MNSGGLIEALDRTVPGTVVAVFPPVNSGGLIEARIVRGVRIIWLFVSAGEFRRPH